MSRSRAASLLAAIISITTSPGCARPTARITQQWLDGPTPPQAVVRCEVDGLAPPVRILWKLGFDVHQVGTNVSDNEPALLVQVPERNAWVECAAMGRDGNVVKAIRSLRAPAVTSAPKQLHAGDMMTLRGSGFGPRRATDDGVYLVPAWCRALALDFGCKRAEWSDGVISGCVPASASGGYELRVQASDGLARGGAVTVTR